ncbi:MAG: TPR end-of-group domain-containing protein, partial [Longimicrobiales bacterium]
SYAISPTAHIRKGHVAVLLGVVLWRAGERERAARLFSDFERFAAERMNGGSEYYLLRYSLAELHAVHGEPEQALDWLERAVDTGWVEVEVTLLDPLLAPLRDEPRFRAIVRDMRTRAAELRRRVEADAGRRP